jgi:hypothetical protein
MFGKKKFFVPSWVYYMFLLVHTIPLSVGGPFFPKGLSLQEVHMHASLYFQMHASLAVSVRLRPQNLAMTHGRETEQ